MENYAQHYSGKRATQGEIIPGRREQMTKTSDGAFVFRADDWTRLNRFLVLGSDGGSYYAGPRKLTRDNAQVVERLLMGVNGLRIVESIVAVSASGRAPKNDPAEFALAMCIAMGAPAVKAAALDALPQVARIGTHLFHVVRYTEALGGGWGRSMRRAVRDWMKAKRSDDLAYQLIKYKQRDGWSFRDLIRLSHATSNNPRQRALFEWVKSGALHDELPDRVRASVDIHVVDKAHAIRLIRDHRLPHEVVPNELKNDPAVWEVLLDSMPPHAMIRNLGKMTAVGLLKPMSMAAATVAGRLTDAELLRKKRVHPIAMLIAQKVYAQGHGQRGLLEWRPVSSIVDALDVGFYKAFAAVEPTGLRTGIFLDVSQSMQWALSQVASCGNMTAAELSAAMALVTANVEPRYEIFAFSSGEGYGVRPGESRIVTAPVTPRQRLTDAMRSIEQIPAGGTDLALPFVHAMRESLEIDTFVVYTDNETNRFNSAQPCLALQQYRRESAINAKLIVVAMMANDISIADPDDAGMLDVEGFDASAPAVMADFARGEMET